MKKVIVALVMFSSAAWGMTNAREGAYSGQGRWRDNQGHIGTYAVTTVVSAASITSTYDRGGKVEQVNSDIRNGANGVFEVYEGSLKRGSGYCMSVQCHVDLTYDTVKVEETQTFYNGSLYKIGSKNVGGVLIMWEEELTKKAQE